MQLFIEVSGAVAEGKTQLLQKIRKALEDDYHLNWRQQDFFKSIPTEQVLADVKKKEDNR